VVLEALAVAQPVGAEAWAAPEEAQERWEAQKEKAAQAQGRVER